MSGLTRRLEVVDDSDAGSLLNVGFASADRQTVDQHFGSARSLVIYGVDFDSARLLSVTEFEELKDDGEDKLALKLEILRDCVAVYCRACGASAVRQLIAAGIQPVKVSEGMLIEDLIQALQQELREGPSTWLARAIRRSGAGEPGGIESDGWLE